MSETFEIDPDPRLVALMEQLKGFVREAALEAAGPDEPLETDGNEETMLDYAAQGAFLAWTMALGSVHDGAHAFTSKDLDEALLPPGTSDEDLTGLAGGIVGGDIVRAALKKLKASLPPGTLLPEVIIELLKDD